MESTNLENSTKPSLLQNRLLSDARIKPTLRDLFKDQESYDNRNERIDFIKFQKEAEDGKRIRIKIEKSGQIDIEELRKIKFTK